MNFSKQPVININNWGVNIFKPPVINTKQLHCYFFLVCVLVFVVQYRADRFTTFYYKTCVACSMIRGIVIYRLVL